VTYQNMPEEQRRQKEFQEQHQPQAQGWAISGDPLREPLPSVPYRQTVEAHEQMVEGQKLEYRTPDPKSSPAAGPAPLFGYIGVGIAIAAMLVGLAGMIFGVIWFIGWMNG